MLRKVRTGLLVWGTILLIFGIILVAVGSAERRFGSIITGEITTAIIGGYLLAGAAILLTFGIINAVKVSIHNRKLLADAEKYYYTSCPYCGSGVSYQPKIFLNNPGSDGYVYCPMCKNPISRDQFREM